MIVDCLERVAYLRHQLGLAGPPGAALGNATGAATGSAANRNPAGTAAAGGGTSGAAFANSLSTALGAANPGGTSRSAATASNTARPSDTARAGRDGPGGSDVVTGARRYLGVPYVFGGTNPRTGLDCSGLVQRVMADLGVKVPRIAADQAKAGKPVAGMAQARPGDLLAFNRPVDHIAIYIGDGKMIAAPRPGQNVKIQKVYETPSAIRRVVSNEPATPTRAPGRPLGVLSPATPNVPYADLFRSAAQRNGLSPSLLAAVAKVESGYNPNAVSPAGARGLMQIMPATARGLGVDPGQPAQAVDGAARLLASHLREFGSLQLALAAYNAGPGAVRRYDGIPPYAETQSYVPKVMAAMSDLSAKGLR